MIRNTPRERNILRPKPDGVMTRIEFKGFSELKDLIAIFSAKKLYIKYNTDRSI